MNSSSQKPDPLHPDPELSAPAISQEELLNRFLAYVKIWTTSDSNLAGVCYPTTKRQLDFLQILSRELDGMGFKDRQLYPEGFLLVRIPGNTPGIPSIGFMAHVDTADDVSGENVRPQVWLYQGEPLLLSEEIILSEKDDPSLTRYRGQRVVTADGTTLLGADDKAGVAALMTVARYLADHPSWPRPDLELVFTTDEETGHGMDRFPFADLRSRFFYTVDGGEEGEIEGECFHAAQATIMFHGKMYHPGYGKGKLVNALTMAAHFIGQLPRSESPEATEGREGNYWPHQLSGTMEEATVRVMIRDFDICGLERRKKAVTLWAEGTAASFPGSVQNTVIEDLYSNMRDQIDQFPEVMTHLENAVRDTGLEPVRKPIRGGTDGSRLTAAGYPCPNIFTGGHNFHGRREWLAVPALLRTCHVLLFLMKRYACG